MVTSTCYLLLGTQKGKGSLKVYITETPWSSGGKALW